MKKKLLFAFVILILIGLSTFLIVKKVYMDKVKNVVTSSAVTNNELENEVMVFGWNDQNKKYCVCNTEVESDYSENRLECTTSFKSKLSSEDMVKTNLDTYLGKKNFYNLSWCLDGEWFYSNNNYYVLSYSKDFDIYTVSNCFSTFLFAKSWVYVPTPAKMNISRDSSYLDKDSEYFVLNPLFQNISFEEACIFYERMDAELYAIDREKEQIVVDGYEVNTGKMIDKYTTFDFKNKTATAIDKKGKIVVIGRK